VRTAVERGDALRALLGQVFPLTKAARIAPGPVEAAVIVGRTNDPGVDVTIPDLSISKRHCAFVAASDGAARVRDCGSKNGTRVNGAKLDAASSVRLCGGETVTLGRLELTFETSAGFAEMVSGFQVRAS
jgi:predicted component of type VI protein secretion system